MIGIGTAFLDGRSKHSSNEYYDKKIVNASINDNRLMLSFEDNIKINIFDDGQSCCENRYMRTDDDVKTLIGHTLRSIEVKQAESESLSEYGDEHEICFLEITTDDGFITISNHNEHNGYYGGFGLTITEDTVPNSTPNF